MSIYCGNNAENEELKTGKLTLGTRYQCLQKGFGVGSHLPLPSKLDQDYVPIDTRKIYCGNQDVLPNDYDYLGNLPMCLQKGVGIGRNAKIQKYKASTIWGKYKYIYAFTSLYVIIVSTIAMLLYFTRPDWIWVKDGKNKKLNVTRYVLINLVQAIILGLLLFLIWYKVFRW